MKTGAGAKNEHTAEAHSRHEGGMQAMFKHVFGVMHEMLHEIIVLYPHADPEQRRQLDEQLSMLKQYSDTFIEEWLQFEEKMADFHDVQQKLQSGGQPQKRKRKPGQNVHGQTLNGGPAVSPPLHAAALQPSFAAEAAAELAAADNETHHEQAMSKGQGYFKLLMFSQAAEHFEQAVGAAPEDNRARLFLAMTYMHLKEWSEAQRHFQLIVELTDDPRWRALGFNALGCIQAIRMNLEQAERYFEKAHEADPEFADPLSNLKSCQQHSGKLSLYFGSGQL
jgi:tetratricopeptide (TPR) repeat protein